MTVVLRTATPRPRTTAALLTPIGPHTTTPRLTTAPRAKPTGATTTPPRVTTPALLTTAARRAITAGRRTTVALRTATPRGPRTTVVRRRNCALASVERTVFEACGLSSAFGSSSAPTGI